MNFDKNNEDFAIFSQELKKKILFNMRRDHLYPIENKPLRMGVY